MSADLLIQCALSIEAMPIIDALHLEKMEDSPFPIFGRDSLKLLISGVGRVRAAAGASCILNNFKSGLLLNAGTCGDNTGKNEPGKIFNVTEVHDLSMPMPEGREVPCYRLDSMSFLDSASLVTADRPSVTREERARAANFGELADMEAGAVLYIAGKYKRECSVLKIVSDSREHETRQEIQENIGIYSEKLAHEIVRLFHSGVFR